MCTVLITRHAELSLVRIKGRPCWCARRWDHEAGKWAAMRSTGVPGTQPKVLAERAARALLKAGAFDKPQPDRLLIPFLKEFWSIDYPNDRLAQGQPLSKAYTGNSLSKIKNYIEVYPPFNNLTIDGLTVDILERWRTWLFTKRGLSARGVNICLQVVKVPLGEALRRGLVKSNPCLLVKNSREDRVEKGCLNESEAAALIQLLNVEHDDPSIQSMLKMWIMV